MSTVIQHLAEDLILFTAHINNENNTKFSESPGQSKVSDYSLKREGFSLPKALPVRVQFATDCRVMLLNLD